MTETVKGFDELRLKVIRGKSEYEIAIMRFPFPWYLRDNQTVMVELYHGKGADLTPRKVAATRVEL